MHGGRPLVRICRSLFWVRIRRTVSDPLSIAGMKSGRVAWRPASWTDCRTLFWGLIRRTVPDDCRDEERAGMHGGRPLKQIAGLYFWVLIRRTVSDDCRDEERAGMHGGRPLIRIAGLYFRS